MVSTWSKTHSLLIKKKLQSGSTLFSELQVTSKAASSRTQHLHVIVWWEPSSDFLWNQRITKDTLSLFTWTGGCPRGTSKQFNSTHLQGTSGAEHCPHPSHCFWGGLGLSLFSFVRSDTSSAFSLDVDVQATDLSIPKEVLSVLSC